MAQQYTRQSLAVRLTIAILLVWGSLSAVHAQIATEFWFVAPEVAAGHGDSPIFLRLSALDEAATVTITQPANPAFKAIKVTIPAGTTKSVDLTSRIAMVENNPSGKVLTCGIYIKSDVQIMAYYEVANTSNPETFTLKGSNALGTSFMVPSQNEFYNKFGNESVEIVATEPQTTVTIKITDVANGYAKGSTIQVVLNKGQTYSVRASNTNTDGTLVGTTITSDKPIAVTIADDSLYSGGAYDLIGDQLVPIPLLGLEYIIVKGFAVKDLVYILATSSDTEIYLNDATTPVATLQSGQQYRLLLIENAVHIRSTKPVNVYHVTGYNNEYGSAILPHISCTGSKSINFVRSSTDEFMLMILAPTNSLADFSLNGKTTTIKQSEFQIVPGTNNLWSYARSQFSVTDIPLGNNKIENTTGYFHLGILNNFNGASSEYGFFSAFSDMNLGDDLTACIGDTVTLDGGWGKDSYLWQDGSTKRKFEVTKPGKYSVTAHRGTCVLTDEINVKYSPAPHVNLGPDQDICAPQNVTLDAGTGSLSYLWQDGSTTQSISINKPGIYWVTVEAACAALTDSVEIRYPIKPSNLLQASYQFCSGTVGTLTVGNTNDKINWSNDSATNTIEVTKPGTFWAVVSNACGTDKATTQVSFVDPPTVDLGPDKFRCDEVPIGLDAGTGAYQFTWNDGTKGRYFVATETGDYTVVAENGCGQASSKIHLDIAIRPVVTDVVTLKRDNVRLQPKGGISPLTYRIDLGKTQETDFFQSISPGVHFATVTDAKGCESFPVTFVIFEYPVVPPPFFSPNDDGINDLWIPKGIEAYPDAKIRVFDRYGQVLFETTGANPAWDGRFNGQILPTTDYWYRILLEDEGQLIGHFTLLH